MSSFVMNGDLWYVDIVRPGHPMLIDRTGRRRVATTSPDTMTVYLSGYLDGPFRIRVLIHELGHCALHSFNLLPMIHRVVPYEYWIDAEEWVCNFIADYGLLIFRSAYRVLGDDAWIQIPSYIERFIA